MSSSAATGSLAAKLNPTPSPFADPVSLPTTSTQTHEVPEVRAPKRKRTSQPAPAPSTLPPTIAATMPVNGKPSPALHSAARDVWYHIAPCDDAEQPPQANLEEVMYKDSCYQNSKGFHEFRRPLSTRLRCILCLRSEGTWKTWTNRKGGVTRCLRDHLLSKHGANYRSKCQEVGMVLHGTGDSDSEASDSEFTSEGLAERLAEWVATDDQALSVVERKEFRRLLLYCCRARRALRDKDIVHRSKLTSTMRSLHDAEKERIKSNITRSRGRISITSDLWSDSALRSFMAVTAHYIDHDGFLAEHLIAFRRIHGHHTGVNVGHALFEIGHITLDNASNNNTLMQELEQLFKTRGIAFSHLANRVRCSPHIINLVVQCTLKALPEAARKFRERANAQGLSLDPSTLEYLAAMELGTGPVDACRDSVIAMRASDVRREGLQRTIRDGNFYNQFLTDDGEVVVVPTLQLLRDAPTRWSSTYEMIRRYLLLYPAVARYANANPGAQIPVVTHKQYEVLQDICSVLSVLHHAQQLLSAERTPTIALALPVYEAIIHTLRRLQSVFPELEHAIVSGIRKIEDYVDKTRDVPVYALAMVINPALKFTWMREHWSALERERAIIVVKEQMLIHCKERHRAALAHTGAGPSLPTGPTHSPTQTGAELATRAQIRGYLRLLTLDRHITRASNPGIGPMLGDQASSSDLMTTPHSSPPPAPIPESDLDAHYMTEVEAELLRWEAFRMYDIEGMGTVGLVEFWKRHQHEFPLLYRIAMDVLPVQASSVSSERAFSSSKLTCTQERNKVSASHVEMLQIIKHSLHRRRAAPSQNHQTLDFVEHVLGPSDNFSDTESDDFVLV